MRRSLKVIIYRTQLQNCLIRKYPPIGYKTPRRVSSDGAKTNKYSNLNRRKKFLTY